MEHTSSPTRWQLRASHCLHVSRQCLYEGIRRVSHSRLGTGCSCSLYDVYYTTNTTLQTHFRLSPPAEATEICTPNRAYNQQHAYWCWKTSRQKRRIAILDVLDQTPQAVMCTLNWRLWAQKTNRYLPLHTFRQTRVSRRG